MKENGFRQTLKEVHETVEGKPPAFADVWAAAEARHRFSRRRNRVAGSIAAAVVVVGITVGLWSKQQFEIADEFLIADSLMNSTSWSAPSDSLMPEHQFDIYQEIRFPDESTFSPEGSLL